MIIMTIIFQKYHMCTARGSGLLFSCPEGTRFQQRTMVCSHWHMVQCRDSDKHWHLNLRIGHRGQRLIEENGGAGE